jgi:hypothetical protein
MGDMRCGVQPMKLISFIEISFSGKFASPGRRKSRATGLRKDDRGMKTAAAISVILVAYVRL